MRVALVYDRLNKLGGAERILVALHDLFPHADWFTSVWDPKQAPFSQSWRVHSSWLNRFPIFRRHHEWLAPLMPFVFESFDFSAYDLVLSVGSAESKGLLTKPGVTHLHYCLTPTRYLHSHSSSYLSNPFMQALAKPLRAWDLVAATRPDTMISISTHVKKRVRKYYNRTSTVLYPPVDTKRFLTPPAAMPSFSSPFFLVVSRLVPYKRLDILVRAFRSLPQEQLVIVGIGSELSRLKRMAPSNVHFAGLLSDSQLLSYYASCRAFLQANEEDFGLGMVEAQAAGKPVIAYGVGGATEIVIPGRTGLLVNDSSPGAFVRAIDKLKTLSFDSEACRQNAARFGIIRWREKFSHLLRELIYDQEARS